MDFKPIDDVAGRPAAWVKALAGKNGVYVISDLFGDVQYIGESHTGRLKKTLLRHFQRWDGPTAGPTFARGECRVAVIVTAADEAVTMQNRLIEHYNPPHNAQGQAELATTLEKDLDPF